MKRNGFTLVELLGVIVLISLLTILVFPRIVNSVKGSSNKTDKVTLDLIYDATELHISNHKNNYPKIRGNKFTILLSDLVSEDLLKSPIKLSDNNKDITNDKCVQVSYTNNFEYELKNKSECIEFSAPEFYGNSLTPVIYDETDKNWKIANLKEEWYDYDSQEWANAVILNEGVLNDPGTIIYPDGNATNIKAMFVWVPRYSYTIRNEYGVQLEGGNNPSKETPGAIDIKFTSKGNLETGNASYTGTSPSEWRTHPAFIFGDQQLGGIWVGKFETSHENQILVKESTRNKLNCTNNNCLLADGLRILPNLISLSYSNPAEFYLASRSISSSGNGFGLNENITNSHMMKNSEWGAVAYLSQSKYGKYGNTSYSGVEKEIYKNDSGELFTSRPGTTYRGMSIVYTGRSNGGANDNIESNYCGTYTYDGYELNDTNVQENRDSNNVITSVEVTCEIKNESQNLGKIASTTGNITGIYDMSGGLDEYVMGALVDENNKIFNSTGGAGVNNNYSGFESYSNSSGVQILTGLATPNSKYFDAYKYEITDEKYTIIETEKYNGHALHETSNWYEDQYSVSVSNSFFFARGGTSHLNEKSGIFYAGCYYGGGYSGNGFRIVLVSN